MKNPNGYGGVSRLPGNRRRPYRARVTVGWTQRDGMGPLQNYATLGYYETRAEAMMALAQFNQSPMDTTLRRMTFRDVYLRWSPDYYLKYPSTRRVMSCAMVYCRPIWNIPLRELRVTQLQNVITRMDRSRGYQSKVRSLMHMVYRWGIGQNIVDRDWSQYVELTAEESESPRRVFTSDEIAVLWRIRNNREDVPGEAPRFHGLGLIGSVLLLLYTGMRVGELLGLKKEDIDIDKRCIDLRGTKTKAARRRIPLHQDILPVANDLIANAGVMSLLKDRNGAPLTYASYKYGWFDQITAALKMPHTPHDARHTFVSALDTAGVRPGALKFIVGHSQRDVTDRYTHKDLPELLREVDKLSYSL